jgi:hypothetical protein
MGCKEKSGTKSLVRMAFRHRTVQAFGALTIKTGDAIVGPK